MVKSKVTYQSPRNVPDFEVKWWDINYQPHIDTDTEFTRETIKTFGAGGMHQTNAIVEYIVAANRNKQSPELVERIERALDITLNDKQRKFLTTNDRQVFFRGQGLTTVAVLSLLFSVSRNQILRVCYTEACKKALSSYPMGSMKSWEYEMAIILATYKKLIEKEFKPDELCYLLYHRGE